MPSQFLTLKNIGLSEYVVKKSRFLGHAKYTGDEACAVQFIKEIRQKYSDASHNVYAYILGQSGEIQRIDDDGEPSGTAAMPILRLIKEENLRFVTVVVTRYFGGILLGAGGLVRSYGKAAKLALDNAQIIERKLNYLINVKFDYTFIGSINNLLSKSGIAIKNSNYSQNVCFTFYIKFDEYEKIKGLISDITNGKADFSISGREYL